MGVHHQRPSDTPIREALALCSCRQLDLEGHLFHGLPSPDWTSIATDCSTVYHPKPSRADALSHEFEPIRLRYRETYPIHFIVQGINIHLFVHFSSLSQLVESVA